MSKVLLVGREPLERILNWREGDAGDSGRDELIDILAAQPAEAEGVKVVAWLNTATEAVTVHPVQVMDWDDESEPVEPLVRQSDHLAALSAVTAERDRLRKAAEPLEPVHGDELPPIGSKVLIHLASCDEWIEHTVAGYYAWGDLDGDEYLHRVFVRVRDSDGYLNARLLKDVRPVGAAMSAKEA